VTGTQQESSACLIEAARTDKLAFSALFRRHYDEIYRHCARRLPDRGTAEDVTSQVFLKMVKNFDSFTGDEVGFRCWLFRIACNEINSYYRTSARHSKAMDKLQQEAQPQEADTDKTVDPENQEKIDFLKTAIGQLQSDHQDILTLRFFQGLNSEQIGEVLHMNPATVRSQLSRSLKKLKKLYRLRQQQTAEELFDYD
jgi:RNA polymerase sigma-70 factor (ECF subfamily)